MKTWKFKQKITKRNRRKNKDKNSRDAFHQKSPANSIYLFSSTDLTAIIRLKAVVKPDMNFYPPFIYWNWCQVYCSKILIFCQT